MATRYKHGFAEDARYFTRKATHTKRINVSTLVPRGGIRL